MAQISGVSRPKKSQMTFTTYERCEISDKFTTRDGTEFVLHEFDSGNVSACLNGNDDVNSFKKKRGRPRKDENNSTDPENDGNCTSFEDSPESKARRERKERKERKREKLLRRSLEASFIDETTPKKRGRPRKLNIDAELDKEEFNSAPEEFILDFSVPSEDAERPCSTLSFLKSSSSSSCNSGIESRNSFASSVAISISEARNYQKQEFTVPQTIPTEIIWTPIQRLTQLNQALAFTNMYSNLLFWDRIIAEFLSPNVQFRLEIGSSRSRAFDIPFIVISKFFWVNAQIGLHRLQVTYNGINEEVIEQEQSDNNETILLTSSDSFIYSQFYAERLMVIQRAFQFIEFNSLGKVAKWNLRIHKHDQYFKESKGYEADMDEFVDGFPKRLIEFLDVALVMNSVLPDTSSWLTWFYTYIQQNDLQTVSIIDLSRAPSPFNPEFGQKDLGSNLEFIERGQDYIFNVLEGEGGRREELRAKIVETDYVGDLLVKDHEQANVNINESELEVDLDLEEMLRPMSAEHQKTENTLCVQDDSVNTTSPNVQNTDEEEEEEDDDDFFDNYGG